MYKHTCIMDRDKGEKGRQRGRKGERDRGKEGEREREREGERVRQRGREGERVRQRGREEERGCENKARYYFCRTFILVQVKDLDDPRLGPSSDPVLSVVEDNTLNW